MRTVDVIQTISIIACMVAIGWHDKVIYEIKEHVDRILESKWFPEPREVEEDEV